MLLSALEEAGVTVERPCKPTALETSSSEVQDAEAYPVKVHRLSRSCGSTLHEGRADGDDDDKARWSELHSDAQLLQLSVLTKCISILYYYTNKGAYLSVLTKRSR